MKYTTILFDFDGTIADTEKILHDVMNSLAGEFGYEPIGEHELGALRAMSARTMLTKRLGIPLWNIFKAYRLERRARAEFGKHTADIRLFDGMADVLRQLRTSGRTVGVVSSNDTRIVEQVLEREQVSVDFIHAGFAVLSKARQIRHALKRYGIDKITALYIGDELRDAQACQAVGIPVIGVGWGFNGADVLRSVGVDVAMSPMDLISKIEHL